jgi:mono/diheme cytochrome c family protein
VRASRDPRSEVRSPRVRALLGLVLSLGLVGCEWFSDFKRQPFVTTWEPIRPDSLVVRGSPQGSVPTTGTVSPAWGVSYLPGPAQIDSLGSIPNPTPVSEASLANGRQYFAINCAVCHGSAGAGNGTATAYGMVGISLVNDVARARSDGYLYGMIRNGRGLMPSYNRIEEMDRWDVVNYVKALQGRAGGVTVDTGAVAPPGVTGDKVPGRTRLGPTRWVPHVRAGAGAAPADTTTPDTTGARRGGDA